MSLFSKPTPVVNSNMVPPTESFPGDRSAGDIRHRPKFPTSSVAIDRIDAGNVNRSLQRFQTWFPVRASKPPDNKDKRSSTSPSIPRIYIAQIAPERAPQIVHVRPVDRLPSSTSSENEKLSVYQLSSVDRAVPAQPARSVGGALPAQRAPPVFPSPTGRALPAQRARSVSGAVPAQPAQPAQPAPLAPVVGLVVSLVVCRWSSASAASPTIRPPRSAHSHRSARPRTA